jgi:hypothetical protein
MTKNKKESSKKTDTINKENKSNKSNNTNDIQKEIEHTLVRSISNKMKPYLNKIIGNYYWLMHALIMMGSGIVLLFDNNIYHLLVIFNIVCIDCIACVFLHDCPLTILENKYLYNSIVKDKSDVLKNANILYQCNHQYEKTLEFLTNMVCFLFGKITFLILLKMFNIQIQPPMN